MRAAVNRRASACAQTHLMDENKIVAAILCAQTVILEDVARDPVVKTVDFYERLLAELRRRGYGQQPQSGRRTGGGFDAH
jgi:hypothetical protein